MGPKINDRIRAREVRVIDDGGDQLGVMDPRDALNIARERGLDLIEVAPQATPPVCRIMDYGKWRYEQGKKEREAAKKQRQSDMKGMTMRPGTDDHDLGIKTRNIVKFLQDGDKVKVTVRFRARELAHPEFAKENLEKIVEVVQEAGVGVVERIPLMEGRQMIMILAPSKEVARKRTGDQKPAEQKPAAAKAKAPEEAGAPPADAADAVAEESADTSVDNVNNIEVESGEAADTPDTPDVA